MGWMVNREWCAFPRINEIKKKKRKKEHNMSHAFVADLVTRGILDTKKGVYGRGCDDDEVMVTWH